MTRRALIAISIIITALAVFLTFALPPADLLAEGATVLPSFDPVTKSWVPQGDTAWLFTGCTTWPAKITAMDVTPDGSGLVIGDDAGYVGFYSLFSHETKWRKQIFKPDGSDMQIELIEIDPDGLRAFVAARGSNKVYPLALVIVPDGDTTMYPVEMSPNPACAQIGVQIEPMHIRWLPDGSGAFIMFQGHILANRPPCYAPVERWLKYLDFEAGDADFRMVHLDSIKKPENEPAEQWFTDQPYIEVIEEGQAVAVSTGNGRILIYDVEDGKLKLRTISRSIYQWVEESGFTIDPSNGYLVADQDGWLWMAYSFPLVGVDGLVLRLSMDMEDMTVIARTSGSTPELRLSPDGRFLLAAGEHLALWDLLTKKSLFHGPWGKCEGWLAQFHPVKRMLIQPNGNCIYYLVERPVTKVKVSGNWTATGRMLRSHDSVYIRGKGKIGVGFGNHRTEEIWWKENEYFLNKGLPYSSADDDIAVEAELFVKTTVPGTVEIYGGRAKNELTLEDLFDNCPEW